MDAEKKDKILLFLITWMKLENIKLIEINKALKDKYT
jgi:hypothetical protein